MTTIKTIYKDIRIERINVFALFIVAFLTIAYLFMANNMAMANYRKSIIIKNIDNIRMEIRNLNLELTGKRSVGFLEKAAQNLNLVVNKSIQYIKISGPVAKSQ